MQGFQPSARRLAQPPQHLADGGAVGFGARGLSQLRELVPKMAAMGYPQQAQAPAPAPVSDPRAAQLMAMIPQMEAMGFKQKPQMLARGGLVRGPGTGTSDSIPDEAEPGTFIMPADSTEAIGPSALEKMGTVPVRLSDGEFKIPPEQVMALGAAVLKLYKDATHTPVNGEDGGQTDEKVGEGAGHKQAEAASGGTEDDAEGMGFSPAQRMAQMPPAMYADGGMVDNNVTRVRTKYSVGDRVQVKPGKGHDTTTKDKQGTIVKITTPALGVKFDGMTMVHKWYTDDEVTDAQGLKAAKQMAKMPEQLYADGGMVDPNRPNSFGDAAAVTRDPGVTQVDSGYQPGSGTVSVVPSQPVAPPAPTRPPNTVVSMINPEWDRVAKQQPGAAPAPQNAAAALTAPPAPAAAPTAPTPAPQPAAAMGWLDRNKQRNAEVSAASITNRPEWSKTPIKPPAQPPEPAPPAPPPVDSRISMPQSTFQSRAAYGYQPRRYADGGMVEDDLQKRLMQIPSSAPPGWNGGGGGSGSGGGAGGVTGSWEAPQATPAPAPAQPAGALTRAASMSAPAPAVQAMGTLPLNPNGGQVSTQSMGAADGLARRGAADALAQMPNAPAPVQAPTVLTSENSWQKRNDLRNALVSASSITANGGRFDRNKGESPESLTYRAMLGTDQALQASAPGLAQAAMREQGDTQRAGLQVAASGAEGAANRQNDFARTLLKEQGDNTRTGLTNQATLDAAKIKAQQELAEQQRKAALKNPEISTALRKEFEGLPEVKNYKQALPAYKGIEDAVTRNTPMSDINIVYGIAKLYDPNSVVREGEYATVANAPNIPERVKGWVQYATNGGKLTPEVKKQIMDEASSRMMSFQNEFEGSSARYRDIAERSNADPTLVISSDYKPAVAKKEEQAAAAVTVPDSAVAHLRGNPALAAQFDAKYGAGASSRYLTK